MTPRKSSGGSRPKGVNLLNFSPPRLGHRSPHLCPPHCPQPGGADPLGDPVGIREVAALIGCSPWTIRQRYLPMGLPHFRSGPTAKLLFYRNQVIRWLMARQKKGGMT